MENKKIFNIMIVKFSKRNNKLLRRKSNTF